MSLEQFISDLNSLAFFREFTFSQNTFKPAGGGTEFELADNSSGWAMTSQSCN
jgi:hypothetical protein